MENADRNGFIKLNRNIQDWEWYKHPNILKVFIHCLLEANYKDNRWQGTEIPRGSFVTSIEHLAKDCGLTIAIIRDSLKKLSHSKSIKIKTTTKFTMISVLNYVTYQGEQQTNNKQIKNETQIDSKQITTNKEREEGEEDKKEKKEEKDLKNKSGQKSEIFVDAISSEIENSSEILKTKKKLKPPSQEGKDFAYIFHAMIYGKHSVSEENINRCAEEYDELVNIHSLSNEEITNMCKYAKGNGMLESLKAVGLRYLSMTNTKADLLNYEILQKFI